MAWTTEEANVGTELIAERDGAVAILTVNRPEAFNALDLALGEALLDALIECVDKRPIAFVGR